MSELDAKNRIRPVCMSIAGLDPSGGAGVLADVRTFAAFRCFPAAAVTSITFQNTKGVYGAIAQSAGAVRPQIEPIFDDYYVAAVKTGMLPSREVIELVAEMVSERGPTVFVVDPVVRSTSGFDLIDDDALAALVEQLFPLAMIVTPNIPEAERITGISITEVDDINAAAKVMMDLGATNVLIKGGHFVFGDDESGTRPAVDHLFTFSGTRTFEAPFIDTSATHGTGCALSSAIAACLARGLDLEESIARAKRFVHKAIASAPMLGKGNSPIELSPDFAEFD